MRISSMVAGSAGWAAFASVLSGIGFACSSSSSEPPTSNVDAATDASTRPAPTFLDPASYADLVTLDPAFPFAVTRRHGADGDILGSRWGRHGGPMVTTGTYGAGGAPKVVAWSVTDEPNAPATKKELAIAPASALPAMLFYGADGMVDLPFGELSLLSYTGSGPPFRGEALFYSAAYDTVKSRAKVNGFYSGVGLPGGTLVYSGLSPISANESATSENALYGAAACDAQCGASWKIFGWKGASGPVAVDAHGNVFVAASLADADTSDAVYGFAKSQITAGATANATTLATVDSGGTSSFAAIAPEGSAPGWTLGLAFNPKNGAYAAEYTEAGDSIAKGGKVLPGAVARGTAAEAISVFTDADGDLWLAVVKGPTGAYLELRRKP